MLLKMANSSVLVSVNPVDSLGLWREFMKKPFSPLHCIKIASSYNVYGDRKEGLREKKSSGGKVLFFKGH